MGGASGSKVTGWRGSLRSHPLWDVEAQEAPERLFEGFHLLLKYLPNPFSWLKGSSRKEEVKDADPLTLETAPLAF